MYGACLSNYNSLVYRICFRPSEFLFPLNQNLGPLQEPKKVKFFENFEIVWIRTRVKVLWIRNTGL